MFTLHGIAFAIQVRTFLSPDDTFGFGFSDYVELITAALLSLLILYWAIIKRQSYRFCENPRFLFALMIALPVVLRLALLPRFPAPIPSGADDFSYILLADTLRHFRLSNPAHPFPKFFEQVFVLQEPTYSSMYALGQGLVLALGWLTCGHPWAGVLLSVSALCGACYWMLLSWTTPHWAIVGGLVSIFQFGPLSYWSNCYWGGAVSATAGCLVFGALPRLRQHGRARDAIWLGMGLGIQLLSRPFEFCLLVLSVLLFFLPMWWVRFDWQKVRQPLFIVSVFLCASVAIMGLHNKQVTKSWTTMPYVLSLYQYGTPPTFTIQPNPVPHRELSEEQALTYKAQSIIHGNNPETLVSYSKRLLFRLRFARFFWLPPLYMAVLVFVISLREFRLVWVLMTVAIFVLGVNFFPYFYPHYIAAIASLLILITVIGMEKLNCFSINSHKMPVPLGSLLFLLCATHFLFWYGVHALGNKQIFLATEPFEAWDYINYGDPQGRIAVSARLAEQPGKKLVFVHYAPGHQFQEWVHNDADIDTSPVIRVQDLGPLENQRILNYYPDRSAWMLEPDQSPPRLSHYPKTMTGFQDVQ